MTKHYAEQECRVAKRTYKDLWYASPIDLPARKRGNVSITHRMVTDSTPVVGVRNAFVRGIRPINARLKEPLRIHELRDSKRGVWMTDLPEELNQMYEMIHDTQPSGRVLIGGLGLGILPAILQELPQVDSIKVVEIDNRVISVSRPHTPGYTIVHDDIVEYLRRSERQYDCYLLDTWQMTNEMTWWGTVMPMKRIIRNKFGMVPKIWCWAEDMMRGQVEQALQMGKDHWYYKGLPAMTATGAAKFCHDVGSVAWEKKYGKIVDVAKSLMKRG